VTDDPVYERLLKKILAVHMAMDPAKLQPIYEAQVARDEMMASRIASHLDAKGQPEKIALVICGRGHCQFGLGIPDRVARRIQNISQRIVLFSDSGELQLTEKERAQAREIEVSHEFLHTLGRAAGDYVQIPSPNSAANHAVTKQ
jgi:uncharacterized iron-regulated protein